MFNLPVCAMTKKFLLAFPESLDPLKKFRQGSQKCLLDQKVNCKTFWLAEHAHEMS
jgi:hypothetical protein